MSETKSSRKFTYAKQTVAAIAKHFNCKKCSLERPECSQCHSTGRKCLGYERETIFLLNNKQYTTQDQDQPKISNSPTKQQSDIGKTPKPDVTPIQKENAFTIIEVYFPETIGQLNLSNTARRQNILASFFQKNTEFITELYGQGTWTKMVPNIIKIARPIESAGLAVALARLGLELGDSRYTQQSLKLYGQGLKEMQLALYDPARMYSDELLGACMLLTSYEMIQCPSQGRYGYLNHHNACARLIQLRGPQRHRKGYGHALFMLFRYWAVKK
jgi:hypothetical protein